MSTVTLFTPYPFTIGEKIRISSGPRQGDWEVAALAAHQVTLRCPMSGREFSWTQFCYRVEEREQEWPQSV